MFEIGKEYRIARVYNGEGQKGEFAFINIEDKKPNGKFADKLTICVWGNHFSGQVGESVVLKAVQSFGLKPKKGQNGEWRKELQCTCSIDNLGIGKSVFVAEQTQLSEVLPNDEDVLPF